MVRLGILEEIPFETPIRLSWAVTKDILIGTPIWLV
jgi:hypothetical protein